MTGNEHTPNAQQFKGRPGGALHLLHLPVGHLCVDQGGLDLLLTQEFLDVADVRTGLHEMGGVGVPQPMDANGLVDPGCGHGLFEHGLRAARGTGPSVLAFEHVFLGAIRLEVSPELVQNAFRQVHIPVLLSFGPADMDLHVAAVEVRHFRSDKLTDPQAHAVAQAQHGVVLQIGGMVEKALHVRRADVLGQGMRFYRPGDLGEEFLPVQHLLEVEFDGVEAGVEGGFVQFQILGAVEHVTMANAP